MSRRNDLKFDPMTGKPWEGMPLAPETYRTLYPHRTWLFSPHTGVQRSSESVVENPHMEYVAVPPHRHVPIMSLDECCAAEGAQRPQHDPVENPKHYTSHPSGVECIQVTEHMGFNLGNAVKYIWRADLKAAALEDLKKARWYLDREITRRGAK